MYENFSDEKLVNLASSGDEVAEEALFRRFKNRVNKIARPYFILGGDGEDLAQEGMIGLYKAIKSYNPNSPASFAAFANICIKNQILDAIRNASSKRHAPLNTYISTDVQGSEINNLKDLGQEPESILISQEERAHFEEIAKSTLSPLEATILHHFLAGETYEQIAKAIGRNTKTVDNALFRIRRKLLNSTKI